MSCNGRYGIGWDSNTPHTHEAAKPTDWEEVNGVFAIEIKNGYYRGSKFSGNFEVADKDRIYLNTVKGKRVRVKTHWFCRRPSTQWPAILIEHAEYAEKPNYSGKVVRNIGK